MKTLALLLLSATFAAPQTPVVKNDLTTPNLGCKIELVHVGSTRYSWWRIWAWKERDGHRTTRLLSDVFHAKDFTKASRACEKWMRKQK